MPKCSVLWCGKYHQNWENDFHDHNFFQLIAIVGGTGRVVLETSEYPIAKGKLFLIPPQVSHAVYGDARSSTALKMMDIKFAVNDKLIFADLMRVEECFALKDFAWFGRYFEKILEESDKRRLHYYDVINSYLEILLVQIIRERLGGEEAAQDDLLHEQVESFKGVDVAELMHYIHTNYSKIISLDDLSFLAQVNKTTLICIFKELYGTTPIRYINRLRLQKAKELLVNTDISISEIAELIGFQSIHYFSRYFRSKENCSPVEYRVANTESKYFSF